MFCCLFRFLKPHSCPHTYQSDHRPLRHPPAGAATALCATLLPKQPPPCTPPSCQSSHCPMRHTPASAATALYATLLPVLPQQPTPELPQRPTPEPPPSTHAEADPAVHARAAAAALSAHARAASAAHAKPAPTANAGAALVAHAGDDPAAHTVLPRYPTSELALNSRWATNPRTGGRGPKNRFVVGCSHRPLHCMHAIHAKTVHMFPQPSKDCDACHTVVQ